MKLAIIGYGGHAREVSCQIDHPVSFFVDDQFVNEECSPISEFDPEKFKVIVAIADPILRKKMVDRLPKETQYFTFIHPTSLIMDKNIKIGKGSFIGANSILTTNISIGEHSILNRGNQIGHDTVIGNFFSAMPGAIVSGNVLIGEKVYIGTNSSIKEKMKICDEVKIGSNGTVVKNIERPGVYVGVPVNFIKELKSQINS